MCIRDSIKVAPDSKVAMETAVKSKVLCLMGETGVSKEQVNFEQIARDTANSIGYNSWEVGFDGNTAEIIQVIEAQDENIAASVHQGKSLEDLGAGDQGIMFGYATDEWDQERLHPLSH